MSRIVVDIGSPGTGRTHFTARRQVWQAEFLKKRGIGINDWCRDAERDIVCDLAGPLAEARYVGEISGEVIEGSGQDLEHADSLVTYLYGPDDGPLCRSNCEALWDHTERILRVRRTWGAITELANALAASGEVSGYTSQRLCERWRVPRTRYVRSKSLLPFLLHDL
jgi:hypothetical protein